MRQSRNNPIFQSLERRMHLSRTVAESATPLPRYATDAEKLLTSHHGPQAIEVAGPAPSGPIDPVAEYDAMEGLVISWTGSTAWLNNLAQMARYVTVEAGGRMYIGVSSGAVQTSAISRLNTYSANLDNVTFYTTPYDSIWARDYGPRYVYEGDVRVITDHEYNRNRPLDDHVPANFSLLKQQQIYQMGIGSDPLVHGGGNFHLATNGDAYMTQLVTNENPSFTATQIQQIYADYQGDDLTITEVFPSNIDATGHIDMWMQIYDDQKVFISDWPNNVGSTQDQICDNTATLMQSRGYEVTRLPAYTISGTHYTFANMVMFNNVVFLPQYSSGPGSAVSANTLGIVQAALGASKTVYGINANSIITAAGAFHCIVQHVPVARGLTGPNGGLAPTTYVRELGASTYRSGDEIDLSWISDDDAVLSQANGVQSVDVLLSTDGGASFPYIVASNQDPLGTFEWAIPDGIDTSQARIKVVATDGMNNIGFDVNAQNFNIDTVPPSINFGFDYEYDQRVTAVPNEIVDLGSITLTNLDDGTVLTGPDLTIIEGDVTIWIKKASGLLSNGNWKLTGPGATDAAGNQSEPYDFDFFVLAGDANRDRVVNFADLLIVAQHYNTSNNSFSLGNFDYSSNGLVDFSDLLIVAQN
ncbi:MAG TPA: agmatine deiminase family protein, partial [Tepidisphaeraceae bacterium]|nr:agmatine deiminase family protein [Tepidisphaeraceae bacterium]